MDEPFPFDQWRVAKANLRCPEFEERYPQLFLVWAPLSLGDKNTSDPPPRVEFHTMMANGMQRADLATHTERFELPVIDPAEPLILPLMKAKDNPFPDRISVGRAVNCDIVIREPSVSKLHGHFREVTLESAVFTDAKSSNGTHVNGLLLTPGVPAQLKSRDEIILGRVRLKVLKASDLYRWL